MAAPVTPFVCAEGSLWLFGLKLFTDYIAKLMGAGLKNVEIFRGKRIRLQRIYREDPDNAASVRQRNRQG